MFKSDVSQTSNQQDATMEILIMLAGAFLLGCLLCWLLRKLFSNGNQALATVNGNISTHSNNGTPQTLTSSNRQQASVVTKTKVTATTSNQSTSANYNTPRIDDLTKISGINTEVQSELKKRDIRSYIDLRDSDKQSIVETLKTPSAKYTSKKEAQTWPHQASLAAKGEWDKLKEYQEFMARTQKATEKVKQQNENEQLSGKDDLKKIEGIGPKIEEILNVKGINTFKELSNTSRDTIKSHLDEAGSRFKIHEPKSWPHQAGMADRGEWDDLKLYQEFMDGGRDDAPSASSSLNKTEPGATSSLHVLRANNDDFKKIEGIGPKIQELLNKAGINTFEDLKNSNRTFIKSLLDEAGPQYRMHEPETWPEQANMAFEGKWEKLKEYQDFLMGGRN